MRILNGSELAGYVKERQAKQVRALRQSWQVIPRLAIIHTGDSLVIDTYIRLKSNYGRDILIDVDVFCLEPSAIIEKIRELNNDDNFHGIIVQLPISEPGLTDRIINSISSDKDVDGLRLDSAFIPATAMAIDWLVAGYNVQLSGKKIAIVGNGRLVGAPLLRLWQNAGYNVTVCDINTLDIDKIVKKSDVVVSATGVPGLIKDSMISDGVTIIDAGTASEHGKIIGDVSDEVRNRQNISITPKIGGVGPLTIAALFDNVIQSARKVADSKGQQDLN